MTRKEVEYTVQNLHLAIINKAMKGIEVNEIRIGEELAQNIRLYNADLVTFRNAPDEIKTIFGIPVVISTARPMALEIATVEAVPVWSSKKEA